MGIRIDGTADLIKATDGSLTVEGESVNTTGIVTASGGFKVGTAATIYSNGNATFSGIITAASHLYADQGHFTDHIYIADKIVHTGDTNTALRFPAADTITGETAGSERFRIDASGLIANNARVPSSYGSPNLLISGTDSTLTLMGDGSSNGSSYTGIKFRVAGASTGDYTKAGIFSRREGGYNLSLIHI